MAQYTVPTVFYQSTLNAGSAVLVPHIKSLSWGNKMNNQGTFELIIPARHPDGGSSVNPQLGGYIRLSPGDTIMKIEKRERRCDEKGHFWLKIGGRPTLDSVENMREAQNTGFFSRYVYNGNNAENYRRYTKGTAVTTINRGDILESSTYEDSLGGFTETEQILTEKEVPVDDTIYEAYSWGTIVTGQPKPTVNTVNRSILLTSRIGDNASLSYGVPDPSAGAEIDSAAHWTTHALVQTTGNMPTVSVGAASGPGGYMNRVSYNGTWIKNDVTNDIQVFGNSSYLWRVHRQNGGFTQFTWRGTAFVEQRTITLKTDSEYQSELWSYLNSLPNRSGSAQRRVEQNWIDTAEADDKVTTVKGGHEGYSFKIKSKGEVEKRYKVDFHLGDTVTINDTRLGVVYTGVVSGATETIDSSGYNVDIELGTLGATLEQRLNKVI